MHKEVVIAGPVRTPIGALNGTLAEVAATSLGSIAIQAALERSAVPADQVSEVIMGNVLSAGLGQAPARQAARGAGLPDAVGASIVNKVCGSGLKAVMLAAQAIQCGDADVVVAGGMESMSRAPYLLDKARNGYRYGHGQLLDSVLLDGLVDPYSNMPMGGCADRCAARYAFSRQQQDDFAVTSYQRALAAAAAGVLKREIVPVTAPAGKATQLIFDDEGPKRFNEAKLRQLKPAFSEQGTVTAGNASSLNDGAAAVVVLSAEKAAALGVRPVAKILGYASASREPEWFTLAPISAMARLMKHLRLTVDGVDLFEINEAFAVVTMAAMLELKIPHQKTNVLGGAVALGHPLGASGARTLVTLLTALEQRNAKIGIVSLCIGGGEAVALAIERM